MERGHGAQRRPLLVVRSLNLLSPVPPLSFITPRRRPAYDPAFQDGGSSALYEAPRPLTGVAATGRGGSDDEDATPTAAAPSTSCGEAAPLLAGGGAPSPAKAAPAPARPPLPPPLGTPPLPPTPSPFHSTSAPSPSGKHRTGEEGMPGGASGDCAHPPAAKGAHPHPHHPPLSGLALACLEETDEAVCEICLEPYGDGNPRTPVGCPGGHGFHLGCTLDWLERGHDFCPLCDGTIGGVAASLLEM